MMFSKAQISAAWMVFSSILVQPVSVHAYRNIYGQPLQDCSHEGMALTGYTRTGQCVNEIDDQGSHHICIDLSSVSKSGGNFCEVTGQPDWCSEQMQCVGSTELCPVENWCVCQWAFASYIEKAGGCDKIQDIVCEAINIEAHKSYKSLLNDESFRGDKSKIDSALHCIESRCDSSRIVEK